MTERLYKWTVLVLMVATLVATCHGPVVDANTPSCIDEVTFRIECSR